MQRCVELLPRKQSKFSEYKEKQQIAFDKGDYAKARRYGDLAKLNEKDFTRQVEKTHKEMMY